MLLRIWALSPGVAPQNAVPIQLVPGHTEIIAVHLLILLIGAIASRVCIQRRWGCVRGVSFTFVSGEYPAPVSGVTPECRAPPGSKSKNGTLYRNAITHKNETGALCSGSNHCLAPVTSHGMETAGEAKPKSETCIRFIDPQIKMH